MNSTALDPITPEMSDRYKAFLATVAALQLRFPVAQIAKATKFQKSNVSEFLNGKKEPSDNFLKTFNEKLPELKAMRDSITAIKPGKNGESEVIQLPITPEKELLKAENFKAEIIEVGRHFQKLRAVPIYDTNWSAGNLRSLVEARDVDHVIGMFTLPQAVDCDVIIPATGKSMEKFICDRDWIGLKLIYDRDIFLWGNAYAIQTDELRIIKYIRKSSKKGCVSIESHDPSYQPFDLDVKKITELWLIKIVIPVSEMKTLV